MKRLTYKSRCFAAELLFELEDVTRATATGLGKAGMKVLPPPRPKSMGEQSNTTIDIQIEADPTAAMAAIKASEAALRRLESEAA